MKTISSLLFLLFSFSLYAQQEPDTSRFFRIDDPQYLPGVGPVVLIDEAHHNFHTLNGRYAAFANILRADGYRLQANTQMLAPEVLKTCRILVISNALNAQNEGEWRLPTPSAFTTAEMEAVVEWVADGGRLFLIADHMPFAGAAADLAQRFGVHYLNCFALSKSRRAPDYFTRADQTLPENELTAGIDSVASFTGSAFRLPDGATSLLPLGERFECLSPQVAWEFDDNTPTVSGVGLHQLGYLSFGKGKVVVSGEAAMFSAQLAGPNRQPMGLNHPTARQNILLLRRLIHWLDR